MIDLYLCSEDQRSMDDALEAAGLDTSVAIDVIGQITLIIDDEPVPIRGWHVNLRGEFTDEQIKALDPVMLPAPANPFRVFA